MARRRSNELPFSPNSDGTFTVGLDPEAVEFLVDLPAQLQAVIDAEDHASTRRLFPPAYHRDVDSEREEEYQRYMREELLTSRRAALDLLRDTARKPTLSAQELQGWMQAINDIRLVLGTQIDVYEGLDIDDLPEDDPRMPALSVYTWLSGLLELIVHGLMGLLPSDTPDAE